MKDPIKDATDQELRTFLNRRPLGRMEEAYMRAAREELKRREEASQPMDGRQAT